MLTKLVYAKLFQIILKYEYTVHSHFVIKIIANIFNHVIKLFKRGIYLYLYQLTGYSEKWWKAGAREHLIEALWYAIQIHIRISEFPRMIFLSTTNPSKQLPLSMRRSLLKNEAHLPLKHESLPHPLKNEATSKDMISTKKP